MLLAPPSWVDHNLKPLWQHLSRSLRSRRNIEVIFVHPRLLSLCLTWTWSLWTVWFKVNFAFNGTLSGRYYNLWIWNNLIVQSIQIHSHQSSSSRILSLITSFVCEAIAQQTVLPLDISPWPSDALPTELQTCIRSNIINFVVYLCTCTCRSIVCSHLLDTGFTSPVTQSAKVSQGCML